jgi:hypothetical protein
LLKRFAFAAKYFRRPLQGKQEMSSVPIGWMAMLILGVLGLVCVGAVIVVTVVATTGARRAESAPHQPVAPCPNCGAVRPASDTYCGACGKALPGK